MKIFAGDFIILHICTKNHNHVMHGSWNTFYDTFYGTIPMVPMVLFTTHLMIPNIKILKKMKKMPGDIILFCIHVYQKWWSFDVWFPKYKVRQMEILVILGHYLPFQPLDNLENQNFIIKKNTWRYYHLIHFHHKWQSYDVWFLKYGAEQT